VRQRDHLVRLGMLVCCVVEVALLTCMPVPSAALTVSSARHGMTSSQLL
jgi:hypothetical protein